MHVEIPVYKCSQMPILCVGLLHANMKFGVEMLKDKKVMTV